jgi:Ring finger domain
MPTVASNYQNWRERRQARRPDHEHLPSTEDEEEATARQRVTDNVTVLDAYSHPLQIPSGDDSTDPSSPSSITPMMDDDTDTESGGGGGDSPEGTRPSERPQAVTANVAAGNARRTFTLVDLEEEREMARRRTSFCVLFAVFILFRIWLEALDSGDFFLLMMCIMGTSWTARFIRHTREREEELDRLISDYHDNGGENGNNGEGMEVDLQRLSFQAQLALAIIQSQRDMMQGNFGNPDGYSGANGVSDTAKQRWERFTFQPDRNGYGSLSNIEDLEKGSKGPGGSADDEPHCSICLGEYEEGEILVCLPCKHVYHEDCVSSWCNNHIRCPLCNFDLESAASDAATVTTISSTAS